MAGVGWLVLATGCGDDAGGGGGTSPAPTGAATDTSASATADPTGGGPTSAGTGDGSGGPVTTGGGPDTGLPPGDNCRVPEDCVIDDDCCHCKAYQDQLPDGHGCASPTCDQTACEADGLPDATPLCLNGNCLLPKIDCDSSTVVCAVDPPMCEGGETPHIEGGCYSGACIPLGSCSQVAYFSCDECGAGEICLRFSTCSGDACGSWNACLPDPAADVLDCTTVEPLCGYFGPGYDCYDQPSGTFCCTGDATACAAAG